MYFGSGHTGPCQLGCKCLDPVQPAPNYPAEILRLQARVKELESKLETSEGAFRGLYGAKRELKSILKEENAKLRKVVDAARFALHSLENQAHLRGTVASLVIAETRLKESLGELDGDHE